MRCECAVVAVLDGMLRAHFVASGAPIVVMCCNM